MRAARRGIFRSLIAGTVALAVAVMGPSAFAAAKVRHYDLEGDSNRPYSIVTGTDGNLWFTESDGDAIGRISPNGELERYGLPTPGSDPYGITVGPDGYLWFTERLSNRIGVMDTAGNLLAEYDLPTQNAQPWDIALGGDHALWFTEENVDQIGRITADGTITEYPLTVGTFPTGIAADAKGTIWFTEELGNVIGRIKVKKPSGFATLKLFPVPTDGVLPWDISPGPDHAMWFTELAGHAVGRITPKGSVREFPVPGESGIAGIATGADGRLWITQNDLGQVRPMKTDGTLGKIYPTRSYPFGITSGPDGNIWFCEGFGNSIGRIRVR
jgi:virginiamycin B lyase